MIPVVVNQMRSHVPDRQFCSRHYSIPAEKKARCEGSVRSVTGRYHPCRMLLTTACLPEDPSLRESRVQIRAGRRSSRRASALSHCWQRSLPALCTIVLLPLFRRRPLVFAAVTSVAQVYVGSVYAPGDARSAWAGVSTRDFTDVEHFPTILDLKFTAHMEDELDDIAQDLQRQDTDRLLANRRFLEERFGSSRTSTGSASCARPLI